MAEGAVRAVDLALIHQAVGLTGATCGWLLDADEQAATATVLAIAGTADPAVSVGSEVAIRGARAFALASDQPVALLPGPADTAHDGIGGFAGTPPSLLVVANGSAVIEVAAKAGGEAFTFDDIEIAGVLASIAAAALAERDDHPIAPDPAELSAALGALAASDPVRYRDVARVVSALLGPV